MASGRAPSPAVDDDLVINLLNTSSPVLLQELGAHYASPEPARARVRLGTAAALTASPEPGPRRLRRQERQ